ncbi:ABC transporter permease subunit [bacterium]|nr:ABC transporter permease subunit [bacterium]
MDNIKLIYRKEMAAFFNSPVAYIVLIVFALITSWFFTNTFFLSNQSDLRSLFDVVPWVYLFFIPAISMGSIAREKNSGTMEFLATLPMKDSHIVLGKFLAIVSLIGIALLFTGIHFITLLFVGTAVDIGAIFSGYFGLLLVGAAYTAIGILGSSVTENQIAAFLLSFLFISILWFLEKILPFVPDFMTEVLQFISIDYHLNNISRGVIDSRNLIYFGSLMVFFLIMSARVLEIRKWR